MCIIRCKALKVHYLGVSGNLHGMLTGQPVVMFGMAFYGPSYRSSFE